MSLSLHVKSQFLVSRITVIGTVSPAVIKNEASSTSSGSVDFVPPHLQENVAGLDPELAAGVPSMISRHFRSRTFHRRGRLGNINPDPTVRGPRRNGRNRCGFSRPLRLARHNTKSCFRGLLHHNANDLRLSCSRAARQPLPLCWQIEPQVSGRKVAAEIFPIKSCDHSEIRCFRQIQWITNRDDRRCHSQLLGFSNRQRGRDCVCFQYAPSRCRISAKTWRAGYFLPLNSIVKLSASPPTVYAV